MKLTDRDSSILLEIQNYGLLPTRTIARRHFGGVALTTVLRRLRLLEKAQYIKRIQGLKNGGHAWCLTKEAAEDLNGNPAKTNFPPFAIEHDIALMDLRMRLEECGISRAWRPEHLIRSKMARALTMDGLNDAVVPDGLIGVEIGGLQRAVAVEVELTAKSQARYRDILEKYSDKPNLWGIWYVVGRPTIGKQLMRAARDGPPYYGGERQPYLLWSLLDEVLQDPIRANIFGDDYQNAAGKLFNPLTVDASSGPSPAQGVSNSDSAS